MSGTRGLLMRGLWHDNPALVQLLGLCPLLAVSASLASAVGLAIATIAVLVVAAASVSLLAPRIERHSRLPIYMLIVASCVTVADLWLAALAFGLHQRVGLFVALIVTNCTVLGRLERIAARQPVGPAALDALVMGLGFALVLVFLGGLRELLGTGRLGSGLDTLVGPVAEGWVIRVIDAPEGLLLAILPPGAFLLVGLLIACRNWINGRRQAASGDETRPMRARIPVIQLPAESVNRSEP